MMDEMVVNRQIRPQTAKVIRISTRHDESKRSTEPLSHFCHRSQSYGIYAMRASAVWRAVGRVLIHSHGSRAASCSGGGLCISFSNTHSK